LRDHPAFDFCAVVDSAPAALKQAQSDYPEIATASSCAELTNVNDIQVLVLATPPDNRLSDIKVFNNLQAVIVEKPLGIDLKSSQEFLSYCQKRNIKVQVNLLRRADSLTSELAAGTLTAAHRQATNWLWALWQWHQKQRRTYGGPGASLSLVP
jgi:predicted dehydrogenase